MARDDPFAHFLAAQDDGTYERALAELREGRKASHWMWFVFPQIAGLGRSETSRRYALADAAAARKYAGHETLGPRLYEATEAMLDWAGTASAEDMLGPVDAMKFRSSMTLFEAAADDPEPFAQAIEAFCGGERDPLTLARIHSPPG